MNVKKQKSSWLLPACSLLLLLLLTLFSSLLYLGQQLHAIHPVCGILFTALILICFYAGVIAPLIQVWRKPIFSMYMLRDKQGRAKKYWCQKLADNLICNTDLSEEEKGAIPALLEHGNESDDMLIDFFCQKTSPLIEKSIMSAAKTAFTSTAISQAAVFDMFSMVSINLQLIRDIVEVCGYRPSSFALCGLYVRILKATFLAGGMEEMDLEEILPLVTGNAAMKLPGLVFASAAQGTVNAFTTIRVGIITRKYLFSADGPLDMKQAKKDSYKEALVFLKSANLHKSLLGLAAKKAADTKEAAAASVKNVWKNRKKNRNRIPDENQEETQAELPQDSPEELSDLFL